MGRKCASRWLACGTLLVLAAGCGAEIAPGGGRAGARGKADGQAAAAALFSAADLELHQQLGRGALGLDGYRQLLDGVLLDLALLGQQGEQLTSGAFDRAYALSTLGLLQEAFGRAYPAEQLEQLPIGRAAARLSAFVFEQARVVVPERTLRTELLVQRMIDAPERWRETLTAARDELTFAERLGVIARAGGLWGARYNHARAAQILAAQGVVDTAELWASVRDRRPGGVCRDVALGQAQMAVAVGIDQAYVLTFPTIGGAFHATLVLQDPSEPTHLIKLDYGSATAESRQPSGPTGLRQSFDLGTHYRLYDAQGAPLTQLPSALGQVLDLALQVGDARVIDGELVDRDRPLVDVLQVRSADDRREARFLYGVTSRGESVSVAASSTRFDFAGGALRLGLAQFRLGRDHRELYLDQTGLTSRVDVDLELGRSILPIAGGQLTAELGVSFALQLMLALTEIEEPARPQGSMRFLGGDYLSPTSALWLELKWVSGDGATRVDAQAASHVYVDIANVAAAISGGVRFVHERTDLRLSVSHQLASDAIVSASGGVALRDRLGDVFFLKAGLLLGEPSGGNVAIDFGLQGSLGTPTHFLPGSDYAFDLGVSVAPNELMNVDLRLQRNLSRDRTVVRLEVPITLR